MTKTPFRGVLVPCAAFALAACLAGDRAAFASGTHRAQCTLRKDGATSITQVTTHVGSGATRLTVVVTTSVLLGGDSSLTMSAALGRRSVLHSTFTRSGAAIHSTTDLGAGFKGVRHLEFDTIDGARLQGQIDGRAVTLAGTAGNLDSLVFADGGPPPTLKAKRAVTRALAKVKKVVQHASCPGEAVAKNAIFDSCDRCKLDCEFNPTKSGLLCVGNAFLTAVACAASPVITPLLCVASFELNGLTCTNGVIDCEQLCEKSDDCCHVHCPGAVGQCCNGDGEVCCGKDGPSGGSCCTSCCGNPPELAGAVCCGRGLISGEERTCINPDIGLCCEPDGTICGGNDCCPPGWTCCNDHYCAPPGRECCSDPNVASSTPNYFCGDGQHCVDAALNLCCAPDAGPECGTQCCPGGQVCGGGTCCSLLDLCGNTCCPSHVCVNGNECCQDAAHVCGGHCCSGFQQCCNGQCCDGVCVGGTTCCPSANRVCGNTCCAAGSACTNVAEQRCDPCPSGGEGCAPLPGNPMCCPSASQCCGNGQCCGEGTTCCGDPPSCHPSFQCVH